MLFLTLGVRQPTTVSDSGCWTLPLLRHWGPLPQVAILNNPNGSTLLFSGSWRDLLGFGNPIQNDSSGSQTSCVYIWRQPRRNWVQQPETSQNFTADALLIIGRLLDLTYLFRLLGSSGSFGILGVPEGSLALARPKGDKLDSLGIVWRLIRSWQGFFDSFEDSSPFIRGFWGFSGIFIVVWC